MKKIVILLTTIATCHLTTARWPGHGHNHWGRHDSNEDREDRDVHPPWWRRKPDSDSNSDEDNSNGFNPWRRSTSSTSSTTTSTTSQPINNDDIIRACVRACPVTSEYNPICGTNGVTYANPGRLECAQQCGVAVQVARTTACAVGENRNMSRNTLETCLVACPVTLDFMPVCGTNNVTYANPARLQCAKNCGVAVSIDKYDPCYRWPNPADSFIQIELTACQQSCPVKVDYAPVCGTDGRTYRNADSLQCARKCGINVSIKNRNKCPENPKITDRPVTLPVTITESSTGTRDPTPLTSKPVVDPEKDKEKNPNKDAKGKEPNMKEVTACMQQCPLTSEYLPICGTDGITYTNPGRLLCSQFCGIDVNVKKFAPCESASNVTFINCNSNGGGFRPATTIEECMRSCSTPEDNRPVCGTNDVTYKNIDKLLCAKRCGIDICVKKQSACDNFVTPPTPVTPTNTPIDQDKDKATTGFVIDPDVLHSLFPDDHTSATDEFDVDERFNDKFSTEKTK